ncbi:MAG: phosphotransferase [Actinomycetota bacterium]|nr:phosphotransferase [Actinomycetota bacterium]
MTALAAPSPVAAPSTERSDGTTSLLRNGHALIAASAITSVLGIAYWVLAAHLYSPEVIGLNSAAIYGMTYVAGLSHLNLMSALVRFLPRSGRQARALTVSSYATSAGVAVIVSAGFLVAVHRWFPDLQRLASGPGLAVVFGLSAVIWCVFVLQDSVLTGLGRAGGVPVENALFAVAKIGLLLLFSSVLPRYGVFCSWILAALIAVVPTNLVIFRRLLPRHPDAAAPEGVRLRAVAGYVAGDYLGYICWLSCTTLMPVLVTHLLGEKQNAYFSLTWVIAYSLYLISASLGVSLIAEGARDEAMLRTYSRRVLGHTLLIVVPAVALGLIVAPQILGVFGADYARAGTTTLRLLLLSAIPQCLISVYVSAARVQRRVGRAAGILALTMLLLFALAVPLMRSQGIVGVGLAWLIAQTVVGAGLLVRMAPSLREASPAAARPSPMSRVLLLADAPATVADRLRRRAHQQRAFTGAGRTAHGALDWSVIDRVRTVSDIAVARVAPAGGSAATAVLKVAATRLGAVSLDTHADVVARLRDDARLQDWTDVLPVLLDGGTADARRYLVERLVPGVVLSDVLARGSGAGPVGAAGAMISELHRRTSSPTLLDGAHLTRLVDEPLAALARARTSMRPRDRDRAMAALRDELARAYDGGTADLCFVHGDFTTGNVLVDPVSGLVTGILDWDRARAGDFAAVDLLHLALSVRAASTGRQLGRVVVDLLSGHPLGGVESDLLDRHLPGLDTDDLRPALLLAWLRHVENNLAKATRYATHRAWLHHNVDGVLRWL